MSIKNSNFKISTGGKAFKVNNFFQQNIEVPKKFLDSINFLSEKAKNYADIEEYKYFSEYIENLKEEDDFGWKFLSQNDFLTVDLHVIKLK